MCMLRSATLSILLMLPAAAVAGCGGGGGSEPDERVFTTLDVTPTTSTLFTVSPENSVTLSVVAKDQDGAVMVGPSSFASANTAVATVSASGVVTAVGAGSTQITTSVTIGGVSKPATTAVTVKVAGAVALVQAPQFDFTPATVDVQAGGSVTWAIAAVHHTIHFTTPNAPTDIPELLNSSDSRTFPDNGEYAYQCTIHPAMTGAVRVH
jgi:plastocyanin